MSSFSLKKLRSIAESAGKSPVPEEDITKGPSFKTWRVKEDVKAHFIEGQVSDHLIPKGAVVKQDGEAKGGAITFEWNGAQLSLPKSKMESVSVNESSASTKLFLGKDSRFSQHSEGRQVIWSGPWARIMAASAATAEFDKAARKAARQMKTRIEGDTELHTIGSKIFMMLPVDAPEAEDFDPADMPKNVSLANLAAKGADVYKKETPKSPSPDENKVSDFDDSVFSR